MFNWIHNKTRVEAVHEEQVARIWRVNKSKVELEDNDLALQNTGSLRAWLK